MGEEVEKLLLKIKKLDEKIYSITDEIEEKKLEIREKFENYKREVLLPIKNEIIELIKEQQALNIEKNELEEKFISIKIKSNNPSISEDTPTDYNEESEGL